MAARPGQRRLALSLVLLCIVVFLCVAPFAKTPLAVIGAFMPIYASALIAAGLVTTTLLLGQFAFLRSPELLVLACAYLFAVFMAIAHTLTFPGIFSATGLLGANPQTAPAIYLSWHGGFPLFVIVYVLVKSRDRQRMQDSPNIRPGAIGFAGMVMVFALSCALTWLATTNPFDLPAMIAGNLYTPAMAVMVGSIWLASLLALAMLWQRRPHSAIDVWLMVVMCAWLLELALTVGLNTGRFDLGFYAGRIFGLLSASFLLVMLLIESSMLYASLIEIYDRERRERRRIQERTAALNTANNELAAVAEALSQVLRPPLLAMEKLAQTLENDYGGQINPEGMRLLGDMCSNAERTQRQLDALLAFSRFGCSPLKPELVQLGKLARDIADELIARTSGREIKVIVDKLGQTRADPELLRLLLSNLIDNAVKFTRKTPIAVIEIGLTIPQSGGTTIYHVKDNGIGFDMRSANSLFRLFLRLHGSDEFEGDGAGLAIAQMIIERHGGRIWAEAMPGSGASFYFTLQSSQAARNAAGSDDQEQSAFPT